MVSLDKELLSDFHERKLKTLEEGIIDISTCIKRNRLTVIFVYNQSIFVAGRIVYMDSDCFVIKNDWYYFNKIERIYNYYTQQNTPIDLLKEWYNEPDEEYI